MLGPDAEAASDLAAHELAPGHAAAGPAAAGLDPHDTRFFGHPVGLGNLFFTEMFERFSYYGMRALLVLFMTASTAAGGLGYDVAKAALIYGLYTSLVYLVNLPGGWIADRLLGQRRSVLVGGIVISLGHFTMAIPGITSFYAGLGLIILGTGLLKPNISVMVGQLYTEHDSRRDAGFTLFYMGINIGAFFAPLVCGYLGQNVNWHLGFASAGIGMVIGMIVYLVMGRNLGTVGHLTEVAQAEKPASVRMFGLGIVSVLALFGILYGLSAAGLYALNETTITRIYSAIMVAIVVGLFGWLFTRSYWTDLERKRLYLIGLLFFGAVMFFLAFEQAGSSLNLFADKNTERGFLGLEIPASFFQSINALFIFTIAPLVAAIWLALGRRGKDPATPVKFGIGLVLVGLGFVVMIGASAASAGGALVSPMWLVLTYLLHTLGELTLSPVGLSAMTKLAPARVSSLMMGVWFLGSSVGSFLAGLVASFSESMEGPSFFGFIAAIAILSGLVFFFAAGPFRRMMEKAEVGTRVVPSPLGEASKQMEQRH